MTPGEIRTAKFNATVEAITAPGQPLEVIDATVNGQIMPVFAHAPARLLELYSAALEYGDRDFLVYHNERWSYVETLEKARCLAWALRQDYKIKPGDRVAIACRNYPEWCVTYLAVTGMGAVIVPLNSWWKSEELEYAVRDCDPALLVLDAPRAGYLSELMALEGLPGILIRGGGGSALTNWNSLQAHRPEEGWPEADIGPDDPATILYTSGSTGHPKGVLSTARAVVTGLMTWAMMGAANKLVDGIDPAHKDSHLGALGCLPLFHITGCNSMFLLSLLQGRKIAFVDKWDVSEAMRLIEAEKLTHVIGVPTMGHELLNAPDRDQYDLSSLEDIGVGGAARPAHQTKALNEAFEGANIGIGYGMTETNALGAITGREIYQERPTSVGQASSPIVSFRIMDGGGNVCEPRSVGEVCIRSASNMREYLNNPAATAEGLRDGWVMTGDLGYLDDDGFLYLVDRKKNLIISGGENISPVEVEEALASVDGVLAACAFAVPDDRLGEAVGALVQVSEPDPGRDGILKALDGRIAHFKLPRHLWTQADALRVMGSGKIDKAAIRKACLAKMEESEV